MLGPHTPFELSLPETPDAVMAAEGTALELDGCRSPRVSEVSTTTVWGTPAAAESPDRVNAGVAGASAWDAVDVEVWIADEFIPRVAKRGASIIEARGASSAASAANAAIDHVRDWVLGTPDGDWVSMAVQYDGSYGVAECLISGFPATCTVGTYSLSLGLALCVFERQRTETHINM